MILSLEWEISAGAARGVERYCPHCQRKVLFTDSAIIRRNANGKNIYEFAIYKCPADHTWNRPVKTYHAQDYIETPDSIGGEENPPSAIESLNLRENQDRGVAEIRILLRKVNTPWRLDKLLAFHINDVSRSRIEKMIRSGRILLNDEVVPTKTPVRTGQVIRILLFR